MVAGVTTDLSKSVGVVVGENLKRIRQERGLTGREFVVELRQGGVPWTHSQLGAIESGRRADIEVSSLALLCHAIPCTMRDLLESSEPVALTADFAVVGVAALLDTGKAPKQHLRGAAVDRRFGSVSDADERLADRLGVSVDRVIAAAERLWRSTLTEERNRRVIERGIEDPEQRVAYRGHVTRELGAQIEAELTKSKSKRTTKKGGTR